MTTAHDAPLSSGANFKLRRSPWVTLYIATPFLVWAPVINGQRLFVSKVRKDFTTEDMRDYVMKMGINSAAIDQIRTRADFYAAFCISVAEKDFDVLSSPDKWDEHIVFREFHGRLHPDCSLASLDFPDKSD